MYLQPNLAATTARTTCRMSFAAGHGITLCIDIVLTTLHLESETYESVVIAQPLRTAHSCR